MVTVSSDYRHHLPTAEDLPHSDDTPVDNELQNDIPNMLLHILRDIWADRDDWFWAVDMGFYYELNTEVAENSKCIIPDGFLALGVPRNTGEWGRLSYVLWQEQVVPILALEIVSKKYNDEYTTKFQTYQELGILYYVIFDVRPPLRKAREHQLFEVYKLINGKYELQPTVALIQLGVQFGVQTEVQAANGKMVWMPEIGLGIGCERNLHENWHREWLYWFDRDGMRYPTATERALEERQARLGAEAIAQRETLIAQQERQKNEKLMAYLKSININPDQI